LFTKFKSKSRQIFLDPLSDVPKNILKGEKLALILSPSLYWVKKISLPVKSVREVIKLLPSIFEDFLPQGEYTYTAYKHKDQFFVFAYEDKIILQNIREKGINPSDVLGVYFAQSAFSGLDKPMKINETQVVYEQNDLVSIAPLSWANEYKEFTLENEKELKHKLHLQVYTSLVDQKSLYKIAALLLALVFILVVEIFISGAKINEINDARAELFAKYKLQATMMQNRSTLKKYTKIYKQQTKLREEIQKNLSRNLEASQSIERISYKNGLLKIKITDTNGKEKALVEESKI
jgi:hypothetical protein